MDQTKSTKCRSIQEQYKDYLESRLSADHEIVNHLLIDDNKLRDNYGNEITCLSPEGCIQIAC